MKAILIIFLLYPILVQAQRDPGLKDKRDTTIVKNELVRDLETIRNRRKQIKSLIIPASLMAYGFVSLDNENLQSLDRSIKEEVREDNPRFHTNVDNYLQYAPAIAVYGLNAIGVKGKNNFRDRTMIYLLSNCIMGVTVQSLKAITKVQRPDGFGTNAFPSGHTATAFVAAEFLHQEYKDASPWYWIGGYLTATATGVLRIYNNRHWFRDLLPGAGIGILSTKFTYWIYPVIKKRIFKDKPVSTMVVPYYQNGQVGITLVHNFHK